METRFFAQLARKGWKVFSSRDAVGLLVDLSLSERGDSLARLPATKEVAVAAVGGQQGEVGALRGHYCFSMGAARTGSVASVGPRVDDRRTWARLACLDGDSSERTSRRNLGRGVAVAEFEAHWKDGGRSARTSSKTGKSPFTG